MEIHRKTISYSAFKQKTENILETKITEEIKWKLHWFRKTRTEKNELLEIRKNKLKDKFIRSRTKWIEEGEKQTKYLCHMESRNFTTKLISRRELDNGKIITDQTQILEETKLFYQNLYSRRDCQTDDNFTENMTCINFNKLSNEEAHTLEREINYFEALKFLKNMKHNKRPGSDGFTAEFLKFFWIDLHCFILSNTQKLGVITCIPNPNKPKHFLKNWRPITLLNCIYKIAFGCIANRIKNVLDNIIAKDQTGFIKGRYIGENIRLIYDIMHYTEKLNIPGMLLLIDFEKAFDSLSWTFIEKALDLFNLKTSMKIGLEPQEYFTMNFLSESFKLERGCKQGDPLSPYIFIFLCKHLLRLFTWVLDKHSSYIRFIMISTTH